ncbi:MAG: DNA gyrase C-terminal beta-propeller domain-containing protein, partial [Dehalococcoidia bacterium]|nr:DNA gyrase C-terminal beta-propeller domain-containing protein [Dehalococcoidia bacterium]
MCLAEPDAYLLTVTERGYGKLTAVEEYPPHLRGGSGVMTFRLTPKTGKVAVARMVTLDQDLLFLSTEGIVLRTPASG